MKLTWFKLFLCSIVRCDFAPESFGQIKNHVVKKWIGSIAAEMYLPNDATGPQVMAAGATLSAYMQVEKTFPPGISFRFVSKTHRRPLRDGFVHYTLRPRDAWRRFVLKQKNFLKYQQQKQAMAYMNSEEMALIIVRKWKTCNTQVYHLSIRLPTNLEVGERFSIQLVYPARLLRGLLKIPVKYTISEVKSPISMAPTNAQMEQAKTVPLIGAKTEPLPNQLHIVPWDPIRCRGRVFPDSLAMKISPTVDEMVAFLDQFIARMNEFEELQRQTPYPVEGRRTYKKKASADFQQQFKDILEKYVWAVAQCFPRGPTFVRQLKAIEAIGYTADDKRILMLNWRLAVSPPPESSARTGIAINDKPHEILGVSEDASNEEILAAYRRLSLLVHPDKNPNEPDAAQLFARLHRARNTMLNQA